MKPFNKRINQLLKEKAAQLEDIPQDTEELTFDEQDDASAIPDVMDDPQTASALKVKMDDTNTNVLDSDKQDENAEIVTMRARLSEWCDVLDDFTNFINGVDNYSMNKQLSLAPPDSLFAKIKSSEGRKISRIAVDAAGLSEALRTYLVGN